MNIHLHDQESFNFEENPPQEHIDLEQEDSKNQPRRLDIDVANGHGFFPERKILDGQVQKKRKIIANNVDPSVLQVEF